jgi:hypothetical protein
MKSLRAERKKKVNRGTKSVLSEGVILTALSRLYHEYQLYKDTVVMMGGEMTRFDLPRQIIVSKRRCKC